MAALTATIDQNFNDVGWNFYAPIDATRTSYYGTTGNTWTTSGNTFSANKTWTGFDTDENGLMVFVAADRATAASLNILNTITNTAASVLPAGTAWNQCVYGGGSFVTVNSASTAAAYLRPKDGISWASATLPSSSAWSQVAYGNNVFVAIGTGTVAARSIDFGATWSSVTLPVTGTWVDCRFANGIFMLIGSGSRDVLTSTDGSVWTQIALALPSAATWSRLAWANIGAQGTWVAVTSNSTTGAYSQDNGATWGTSTLPASGNWLVAGGKAAWDGLEMFSCLTIASTAGAFSYDGINWTATTITSAAYNKFFKVLPQKINSGDSVTINNGAVLTVNSTNSEYLSGAGCVTITNGKLKIENSSTTTPIVFGTGRLSSANVLNSISATNGLGSVDITGNWIEIGTGSGAAGQTLTSPYANGNYIPVIWVETASGSNVYEEWVNVTGSPSYMPFNYARNGLNGVGNADGGTCFTQGLNQTACQYLMLANTNAIINSNVMTCTSTAGLLPGSWVASRSTGVVTGVGFVVQKILSATAFTVNNIFIDTTASKLGGTWANIPAIAILPLYSQYTPTLTVGDGTNGKVIPVGAKVRVPNILITDYTNALWLGANYAATNAPACFTTPTGGKFNFDKCLFGESYSILAQAGEVNVTNAGFSYVPWVSETYTTKFENVAFGTPPVYMYPSAATALGATGSCTVSTTTVAIPASTAIIPGAFLYGTGLQANLVSTVNSNISLTVSSAAHTTTSNVAYSYMGVWLQRDMRMDLGASPAAGQSFHSAFWTYVSNLNMKNVTFTHSGNIINGTSTNPSVGSTNASALTEQYSNNVTVDGMKVIGLGSYPRSRPAMAAIVSSIGGSGQTYNNIRTYNYTGLLHANSTSNITLSNTVSRAGILNEAYNLVSAQTRIETDPNTGGFILPENKYWIKLRSRRTHDWDDPTGYIDSPSYCVRKMAEYPANMSMPRTFGIVPNMTNLIAPAVAYGNGRFVVLNGTASNVGNSSVLVSTDNGSTWTSYALPSTATASMFWKDVIWSPTQNYFVAIAGGVANTLVAYSPDGVKWSIPTTAPASAIWTRLAFDNTIAANKWVGVSGGSAVSTAGTYATMTNGSLVFAASTLVSAQWISVAASGAGRFVAIAGGSAGGTATSISTTGNTWSAGGANVSSLWQDIAYGSGKFVCISSSATNGPTSYSTDGVAWTAGTATALPVSTMRYNRIIWTGTVFVLLAGPTPLNYAAASPDVSSMYFCTSADGITWSALKTLPDNSFWVAAANNGNAVGVVSSLTGRFAYTSDISVATPTWTMGNILPIENRISVYSQSPDYTTAFATLAAVSITKDSTTCTCTSTAAAQVGMLLSVAGLADSTMSMFGTNVVGTLYNAVYITGITNGTTFTISSPAIRTASSLSLIMYKNPYQIFRSTTPGFTARDATTLIGASSGVTAGWSYISDVNNIVPNTEYHYVFRKLGGSSTVANCSGTTGTSTITTSGSFFNFLSVSSFEGKAGSNILMNRAISMFTYGIVPGCKIIGTGIPANTTVLEVPDFDVLILSNNLTSDILSRGTGAVTVSIAPPPGAYVYGSNVGLDCKVVSVDSATSMTVSINNTNTFTNQTLRFIQGNELPEYSARTQNPEVIHNLLLQSSTLVTTPWVNTGVTSATAAILSPIDNFVGWTGAVTAGNISVCTATTANGTTAQPVNLGVGSTYTFSCYARARHPDLRNYLTFKMDLDVSTATFTLTNQWKRYFVTHSTTAVSNSAKFTFPALGTQVEIANAMVTLGSTPPVITAPTTTLPNLVMPQRLFSPSAGLYTRIVDDGAIEMASIVAAVGAEHYVHAHLGSTSTFSPALTNLVASSENATVITDPLIAGMATATNIQCTNIQPYSNSLPNHACLLSLSNTTSISIKDSTYAPNGTYSSIVTGSPGFDIYLHNIDVINPRSQTLSTIDGGSSNSSGTIKFQNIRSSKGRIAANNQGRDTIFKSFPGLNTRPDYNTAIWDLSNVLEAQTLTNTAVYDSSFTQAVFGNSGLGCLNIIPEASAKTNKPYTVTAGSPFFDNSLGLYMTKVGDQIVFEWPHVIKGVTGFSKRIPHIYGIDAGLNTVTSRGILAEYDINTGGGYTNVWKKLNGLEGAINLSSETVSASGFTIKFRFTARPVLKYTGQSSQFAIGETIWNKASGPTATAVVVEDENIASTTGSLVLSNITGVWVPSNSIYSSGGVLRSTITAVNTVGAWAPQPTTRLSGVRLFTTVDNSAPNDYPFFVYTMTFTGLPVGTDIVILSAGTNTILAQQDANPATSYSYVYYNAQNIDVGFIKPGFRPYYIRNLSLTAGNSSLPISLVFDRNYS